MIERSNVTKLMIEKIAVGAVPPHGGLADVVNFLSSGSTISDEAIKARHWVKLAIKSVREAADPNPWKNADDEEIAGEILRQVEEKRKQQDEIRKQYGFERTHRSH